MRDLQSHRLIILKGVLFVVLGLLAAVILLVEAPTLRNVVLLLIIIWSFSRAYYFAFYVIQHYIDPSYRFAGLFSAARFLLTRRKS